MIVDRPRSGIWMVTLLAGTVMLFLGAGCGGASDGTRRQDGGDAGEVSDSLDAPTDVGDATVACFPCKNYWTCGDQVGVITLEPQADGCHLSGLPGQNLLAPDGTITEDGLIVATARGTGARVQVNRPDGSQWLFCAGGSDCPMPL